MPRMGITRSLPTIKLPIALRGRDLHWLRGTFSLARADPSVIKLIGTDASPMNVAVFMINASGGWRSGAGGMFVPGTPGTKRAFIGGMIEMMKDTTIDKDG